jgi:methylated-DNA-[protein]-cysteine S-methyltransferase
MAYYDLLETPLGTLFIGGSEAGLHRIEWVEGAREEAEVIALLEVDAGAPAQRDPKLAAPAVKALSDYFEGRTRTFDLPVAPRGSAFQQAVWRALLDIAPGDTASYGEVAAAAGRPGAARAVGQAVGSNPISVVVPCHRVIGANGSLTGFGGGLKRKVWLLEHEAPQAQLHLEPVATKRQMVRA